jgi:uncharacterized protein (DUF488 family)
MLTIGHSTLPIEVFLKILAENDVKTLVDIRTIPKSRHNPQFAQDELSVALAAHSIEYHWQPSLGGLRKPSRDSLLNAGWVNASFRGYADYMQTPEFAHAIDELLSLPLHSGSALLCAEAVPWRCHRSLVADALVVRGVPVEHILYTPNGASKRQPHQITKFARVQGMRLWYPGESNLFAAAGP